MDPDDETREDAPAIKVIGIGQTMRGDDGAGLAAVRLWQQQYADDSQGPQVTVELAELPGIGLLNLVDGVRTVVLVDAVRSGAVAGTVFVLTEEQLEAFATSSGSAHGLGVAETLSLGRKVLPSQMPQRLILIGIEAGDVSLGDALSAEVQQALPEAVRLINQTIQDLR